MPSPSPLLVYGLLHPRTELCRYVGRSSTGMVRPKSHWSCRRSRSNPVSRWCLGLPEEPVVLVLERCRRLGELCDAERRWMRLMRSEGLRLLNLRSPGKAGVVSMATRRRISLACRGRTISEEQRRRISESLRGRVRSEAFRRGQARAAMRPCRCLDCGRGFRSRSEAAVAHGVSLAMASMAVLGLRRTAGGHRLAEQSPRQTRSAKRRRPSRSPSASRRSRISR